MKQVYISLFITSAMSVPSLTSRAETPPYSETFDDAASLSAFTVINNNNDSKTWVWDSSTQAVKYANSWKDADDYLVLPGLELEAGKLYTFSFDTYRQSSFRTEKIAAYVGTSATVAGLTTELMPPTEVDAQKIENQKETYSLNFTPEASGTYYFSVKACSDASQMNLYVDNVAVTAAKVTVAPGEVRDFTVTPAPLGALKANISFRVPLTNISGETLDEIDKVMVYRGEDLAATVEVTAGSDDVYTCTDENAVYGESVYRAMAHNSGGLGLESRITVFIGNDRPTAPTALTLKHGEGDADAIISWEAPALDVRGLSLDPTALTFKLKHTRPSQEWYEDLADGVTDNTYSTTEGKPTDEQAFYKYSVRAVNRAGEGDAAFSEMWIPLGKPDAVPYTESFSGGTLDHIFRTKIEKGTGMWAMGDDDTQEGLASADGDNGFIICNGAESGDVGALYSGRIDLAGLEHPQLSFCYFNYGSDDTGTITVLINSGQGFEPLGEPVRAGSGDEQHWNLVSFPLDAYKGTKIELAFKATMSDYKSAAIDKIIIADRLEHDLSTLIEAPAMAIMGRECAIEVSVTNEGALDSEAYTVSVCRDGEIVATLESNGIVSGAIERLTCQLPVSLFDDPGTVTFTAVANYSPDMNPDNNTSNSVVTAIVNANHPTPQALTAAKTDDGAITLTWTAPDLANGPKIAKTDNFESYESFATEKAGEWTFVDMDGAPVDGPSDFDIPNVEAGSPASFFIMDTSGEDFRTYGFNAFSGNKVLAAVFNMRGVKNDDWAISPRLSGQAQVVTLRARSYSSKYPDSFEILYSTGDSKPESFIRAALYENIPSAWKEYAAQLPEGTNYMAIRYVSADAFIIMIDDVAIALENGTPAVYTLEGYNVYRDRELIGTVPSKETTYTDSNVTAGSHQYNVTALYAGDGESDPSIAVTADPSSLNTVVPEDDVWVTGGTGSITVVGAIGHQATVLRVDGSRVCSFACTGNSTVSVPAGIYIVTAAGQSFKVIAR